MPRLLYGNFDFEESLIRPAHRRRPESLERILAELATTWVAVAERDDVIWCRLSVQTSYIKGLQDAGWPRFRLASSCEEIPPGCEFVPWGWSEEAVAFGTSVAGRINAPPPAAVRAVNSRHFAFRLEETLGLRLAGAVEVSSINELMLAVERLHSLTGRWLVKSEFSQAGRDRFRFSDTKGRGHDRLNNWARRQLSRGQRLNVEPWLHSEAELGIQLSVEQSGGVQIVGLAEMITGSVHGQYCGSIVSPLADEADWQDAITAALEAGKAAAALGYFGPIGIDAMRFRDEDGTTRIRALQDVNARWTMGRLSLGLRRFIPEGTSAHWRHSHGSEDFSPQSQVHSHDRRVIPTSPGSLGGQPVRLSHALIIDKPS